MMKTQCFVCMFMDIAREVTDTFIGKSVFLKKGKVQCNNRVYVRGHKYVLGPIQTHFSPSR